MQALRIELGTGITGHVAETGRSVLLAERVRLRVRAPDPGHRRRGRVGDRRAASPTAARVTGVVFLSKLGVGQFDENDLRAAGGARRLRGRVARERAALREPAAGGRSREGLARVRRRHLRRELAGADRRRDREGDGSAARVRGRVALARGSAIGDFSVPCLLGLPGHAARRARCATRGCLVWRRRRSWRCRPRRAAWTRAELGELFRRPEMAELGPVAVAPLPSGHGVRGWLMVGRPMSGERGLTDERLRLLEGLSYRAAMALQKARLARHREQSLHVAERAARVRPRTCPSRGRRRRGAHRAPGGGDARGTGGVALAPGRSRRGCRGRCRVGRRRGASRARAGEPRFAAEVAQPFSERPEPFVLQPEQYADDPGADGARPRGRRRRSSFHARPRSDGLPGRRRRRGRDVRRASAEDARRPGRPGRRSRSRAAASAAAARRRRRTGRGSAAGPRPARGRRGA